MELTDPYTLYNPEHINKPVNIHFTRTYLYAQGREEVSIAVFLGSFPTSSLRQSFSKKNIAHRQAEDKSGKEECLALPPHNTLRADPHRAFPY